MSNDNGLIDEYEKLEIQKKEIEQKEEDIKKRIIELAKEKKTRFLFGSNKKCFIKEYEKVIYPEDKKQILELINKKGLYNKFSSINYFKLNPAILKGEVDKEIADLTKREMMIRIFLKDIKNE
ncbi:hypothetical protein HYW76_02050 [Candidatus Pacearchaeota archaeon]|nr:hypothetical protein [Candidatus Pacearchaeota archaeon]